MYLVHIDQTTDGFCFKGITRGMLHDADTRMSDSIEVRIFRSDYNRLAIGRMVIAKPSYQLDI